jgi:beta-phosphoglucomutase-like phosphatase (HAD superfamily)
MKKIISWDLDGVIANSQIKMIEAMNEILDKNNIEHPLFVFDKYDSWNYAHDELAKYSTDEEIVIATSNLFDKPEFLEKAEMYPDTVSFFEKLKELGIENQINTSRPAKNEAVTIKWLEKNNLLKYFSQVNVKKTDTDGREYKIAMMKKMGALIHFDDDPIIVERSEIAYLVDRPWNWSNRELDNRRVKGWDEIWEKILQL